MSLLLSIILFLLVGVMIGLYNCKYRLITLQNDKLNNSKTIEPKEKIIQGKPKDERYYFILDKVQQNFRRVASQRPSQRSFTVESSNKRQVYSAQI